MCLEPGDLSAGVAKRIWVEKSCQADTGISSWVPGILHLVTPSMFSEPHPWLFTPYLHHPFQHVAYTETLPKATPSRL